MTPNEIKEMLADRNLKVVSERAGVSYSSLMRFMRGDVERVDYRLIESLKTYLRESAITASVA